MIVASAIIVVGVIIYVINTYFCAPPQYESIRWRQSNSARCSIHTREVVCKILSILHFRLILDDPSTAQWSGAANRSHSAIPSGGQRLDLSCVCLPRDECCLAPLRALPVSTKAVSLTVSRSLTGLAREGGTGLLKHLWQMIVCIAIALPAEAI